jgi:hypothetical protein
VTVDVGAVRNPNETVGAGVDVAGGRRVGRGVTVAVGVRVGRAVADADVVGNGAASSVEETTQPLNINTTLSRPVQRRYSRLMPLLYLILT